MNAVLVLKLALVPMLILGVTLAGGRWGPSVAGWLSAFPIVAGPILFTLNLEQGAAFAAHAAQGTLLAVVAILVFSFAHAGSGRGSAVALLRGMVVGYFGFAVFCVTLAMQLREGAVGSAFALALGCALAVHHAARRLLARPAALASVVPQAKA
jgi:hypothetical protein